MKKSEIYRLAQLAVVTSFSPLKDEQKVEVLRELMDREHLEKFCEDNAEKEAENNA